MILRFEVVVEVNKTQGKFVAKDDLREEVRSALEEADLGTIEVDESEYEVQSWEVNDAEG